ncbi:hypothetical protein LCGC14_0194650 [marine sediment metagenome]|uniref:Uncharacterized protein n=1 Tax=marine sediment metagenome TaxID=412755 RepID=A0A0F9XN68_9ZZZZ
MSKRTLKPRTPTRTPSKRKRRTKTKAKTRKNESSFPKKTARFIFTLLPIWTWKLSVALWHAFDHERKAWIIFSRIIIAMFIFPFLWLGMIGLYVIMIIPATIYGLLAIYLWSSHKFAAAAAGAITGGGLKATNPKNKKVR